MRPTVPSIATAALLFASAAISGATAYRAATAPDHPHAPLWSAVVETSTGDSYIVEHGASLSDCMARLKRPTYADELRYPVTYCESESAAQ